MHAAGLSHWTSASRSRMRKSSCGLHISPQNGAVLDVMGPYLLGFTLLLYYTNIFAAGWTWPMVLLTIGGSTLSSVYWADQTDFSVPFITVLSANLTFHCDIVISVHHKKGEGAEPWRKPVDMGDRGVHSGVSRTKGIFIQTPSLGMGVKATETTYAVTAGTVCTNNRANCHSASVWIWCSLTFWVNVFQV